MYTSGLCRIFNISENFYPLDAAGTLYLLYSKEAELLKISYDINDDGIFEDYVSSEELFPFVLDYKPIEQVLESNKKSKKLNCKDSFRKQRWVGRFGKRFCYFKYGTKKS